MANTVQDTSYGVPAIGPSSFANNFLGFAQNFLTSQMNVTARQNDYVQAASLNAAALTAGSITQANSYSYGLFFQQSQFLNNLGMAYADVAKTAVNKMSGGGIFSSLF